MDEDTVRALVGAVAPPTRVIIGEEHQYAVLPPNHTIHNLGALGLLPPPARIVQQATLLTVESFCSYVKDYSEDPHQTKIFADEPSGSYEAVLNYHNSINEARGHSSHVAKYRCPTSPQWDQWKLDNGKGKSQVDFARLIEESLPDIVEPSGARMLEMITALEIHKNAQFRSDVRMDNGERQLQYEETVRGTARGGNIEIPQVFAIAIPIFIGGRVYRIEARLRYRMENGALALWYELVRPNEVYRKAIEDVTQTIKDSTLIDATTYVGKRG